MRKLFLFIPFILLVNSCTIVIGEEPSKHSRSFLSSFERKSANWNDILIQPENEYYFYIYSETCGYCRKREPDIVHFSENRPIYYVLLDETIPIKPEREDLIGCEDFEKLFVLGTPTLFQICEKKVKSCYIGFYEILEHIKEVTYTIETSNVL